MPTLRELTPEELNSIRESGVDASQYEGVKVPVMSPQEVAQEDATKLAAQQQQPTNAPMSTLGAVAAREKAGIGGQVGAGGLMALGPFRALGVGAGALVPFAGIYDFHEGR